jgi:glycerol-3-phosphate acyltransferase PlsY
LVGKGAYGIDLRTRGSGNLGATNTFRVLGWKAAAPVVVFDVLKGWLPVWLFPRLLAQPDFTWMLLFGSAAIVGHVFSIWVRFRGGKGVATSAGVFLALAPWALLVVTVVFAGLALATRIVSVGSLGAAAVLPVAVALTPHAGGRTLVAFSALLAAFVIWAHRSNLGRLLRGEESRFERPPAGDRSPETTHGQAVAPPNPAARADASTSPIAGVEVEERTPEANGTVRS